MRTLKELARSYLTITKDVTRVMNRLKALYRSWGIPCAGNEAYAPRHRSEWLSKISEAGDQQSDALRSLRQEVRRDLIVESKKHKAWKLLRQIPGIGPIRAALLSDSRGSIHRTIQSDGDTVKALNQVGPKQRSLCLRKCHLVGGGLIVTEPISGFEKAVARNGGTL